MCAGFSNLVSIVAQMRFNRSKVVFVAARQVGNEKKMSADRGLTVAIALLSPGRPHVQPVWLSTRKVDVMKNDEDVVFDLGGWTVASRNFWN